MTSTIRSILLVVIAGLGLGCAHTNTWPERKIAVEFIGEATFATGYQYRGFEVGGLSGIDYDPLNDRYIAISDDQAQHGPVRFFELHIDLADGALHSGDVTFTGVTQILDKNGQAFASFSVDAEAVRYSAAYDRLAWTSEGTASGAPFIRIMTLDGKHLQEFLPPDKFFPGPDTGARRNKVFESLTLTVDQRHLITATENALHQDGPAATMEAGSSVRVLLINIETGNTVDEFIYLTEPVTDIPSPADAFSTNGLVELLSLDESHLLALERSYSSGVGNNIRLFLTTTKNASSVRHLDSIANSPVSPMQKALLFDLDQLDLPLDNIEGMTFGPTLPDGSHTLILVSDNNFNPRGGQFTQFLAFKLSLTARPSP